MADSPILFSTANNLATIRLNRPEARNALTPQMIDELAEAIRSCASNDVRAVLISGEGEAFSAGADVKVFLEQLEEGGPEALSRHLNDMANVLHRDVVIPLCRLEKPVVAAINGVAAGAGFSLMLSADLRIAASNARFLMAYANIGAPADGGSTYLLPRLVGAAKAMDLYLATQPISAEAALQAGLVSQLCDQEQLAEQALEVALRLSRGPTTAYARVKTLFEQSWTSSFEDQLDAETKGMRDLSLTHDFQEGIRAFTEKRQPSFTGK